jgi:hypothetical protein
MEHGVVVGRLWHQARERGNWLDSPSGATSRSPWIGCDWQIALLDRPIAELDASSKAVQFVFFLLGLASLLLGITSRPASSSATNCRIACELILTALPIRMVGIMFLLMSK